MISRIASGAAGALIVAAAAAAMPTSASAQATQEITLTISKITALDRIDWGLAGDADFYAKVTIAGETFTTQRVRGKNAISPNWKITKAVAPGQHDVKVEIFDRDPLKPDDRVDINRLPNKRDLDFTVDTKSCRIGGFSSPYRCKQSITRPGDEKKKAAITFRVDVAKKK